MTRVANMGELTTSLAHEINQPLTAILTNTEAARRFLSQATPDISEVRQILEDIIRDNRRAGGRGAESQVTREKGKAPSRNLDLNQVIQEVVDLILGELVLQGVSIRDGIEPGFNDDSRGPHPTPASDPEPDLEQPRRHEKRSNGSTKTYHKNLNTGQRDREGVCDGFRDRRYEGNIERLFEPFYTTKPEGLGMGLSISQTIIKAHGGTMEASNNPEGGATFAFNLPCRPGDQS